MEAGYVKIIEREGYSEIVFHHPKANSLTSDLLQRLAEAIMSVGEKESNNCVVLRSEGQHFCTGASFNELLAIENKEAGKAFFMGFARVIMAMREVAIPVVTQVQGIAVGGGVGIVAASDYVIASDISSFKLSEFKVGIGPFVISEVLKKRIGGAKLAELTFNPLRSFSAEWAYRAGLVSEVVSMDELNNVVQKKAIEIAGLNRSSLLAFKSLYSIEGLSQKMDRLAEMSGRLVCQEDTKEFLINFLSK